MKTDTALSKKNCTCYEYVRTLATKLQVYHVTELQLPKYSEIEHILKGTEQKRNNRIKESKIEIVWCQDVYHQHHL